MRLIDADALKKKMQGTYRYFQIKYDIDEAPTVAISSAEPREVIYSGDGYADGEMVYDMAECMNCGREFEYGDETWGCKFCPDCGQALEWDVPQESEG